MHSTQDLTDVDYRAKREVARAADADADLLAHERRLFLAAEDEDLHVGRRLRCAESEPRGQLSVREVVTLNDEFRLMRRRAEPRSVDADVSGDRIGRLCGR